MLTLYNQTKDKKIYIIIALIFVTVFMGVLCSTAYYNVKSTYYINSLPESLKDEINILVGGIDDMNSSIDALTVVTLKPTEGIIHITGIPTETAVKVIDESHPIKNIYSIGGSDMLTQKVAELFDVEIKYFAFSKFSTFENVIDILGGVEIDVPYDMYYTDKKQNLTINITEGKKVLDGENALNFARYNTKDNGERENNIQTLFKELANQKLNGKYISKIPSVAKEIIRNTKTNLLSYDTDTYIAIAKSVAGKVVKTHTIEGYYESIDGYLYFFPDITSAKEHFLSN